MILGYTVIFVVGIILGAMYSHLSTRQPRSPTLPRPTVHLDEVDNMVLWGEVTNDPFYKW